MAHFDQRRYTCSFCKKTNLLRDQVVLSKPWKKVFVFADLAENNIPMKTTLLAREVTCVSCPKPDLLKLASLVY